MQTEKHTLNFGYDPQKVAAYARLFKDKQESIVYLENILRSLEDILNRGTGIIPDALVDIYQDSYIKIFNEKNKMLEDPSSKDNKPDNNVTKTKNKFNKSELETYVSKIKSLKKKNEFQKYFDNYIDFKNAETFKILNDKIYKESDFPKKTYYFKALENAGIHTKDINSKNYYKSLKIKHS